MKSSLKPCTSAAAFGVSESIAANGSTVDVFVPRAFIPVTSQHLKKLYPDAQSSPTYDAVTVWGTAEVKPFSVRLFCDLATAGTADNTKRLAAVPELVAALRLAAAELEEAADCWDHEMYNSGNITESELQARRAAGCQSPAYIAARAALAKIA